jgi:glycosyltransferase involved in cell wall biosynthesis
MAMARPVVTTPGALEGINAQNGRDLLTGTTAEEIATAVEVVLSRRAVPTLGEAARAFVLKNHEWGANLRKLDALIDKTLKAS